MKSKVWNFKYFKTIYEAIDQINKMEAFRQPYIVPLFYQEYVADMWGKVGPQIKQGYHVVYKGKNIPRWLGKNRTKIGV
jgi:hypothetical protein